MRQIIISLLLSFSISLSVMANNLNGETIELDAKIHHSAVMTVNFNDRSISIDHKKEDLPEGYEIITLPNNGIGLKASKNATDAKIPFTADGKRYVLNVTVTENYSGDNTAHMELVTDNPEFYGSSPD